MSVGPYHGSSIGALLSELRQFFRFLYLNGYHTEDRSLFIPRSNALRTREHLPVFWTREDVEKVLSVIDVGNPIGKRDYAMILLAARLGLRVSDVKNLKFSDIKWEKNSMEINQYKTKEPLALPLPEDVGNAIIDYLQNGRPQSDVQNIFIRHQPVVSCDRRHSVQFGFAEKILDLPIVIPFSVLLRAYPCSQPLPIRGLGVLLP